MKLTRIAQSALSRIAIGDLPMASAGEMSYDDDSDFTYSVEVQEGAVASLQLVSVTVTHPGKSGNVISVQLSQMMLLPTYLGSTQDLPLMPLSSTNTTTSTSGSTGIHSCLTTTRNPAVLLSRPRAKQDDTHETFRLHPDGSHPRAGDRHVAVGRLVRRRRCAMRYAQLRPALRRA